MNIFGGKRDLVTLDIGSRNLTMAKFSCEGERIKLNDFRTLRFAPTIDTDENVINHVKTGFMKEVIKCGGYNRKNVRVAISDQAVFPRYIALPNVASDKLTQIIQYEAEQNVPFPIDEVAWDFSATYHPDKVSVLLVAVKIDNVQEFLRSITDADIRVKSLCSKSVGTINLVRYNYLMSKSPMQGSVMVLDIGDRSTSISFVEGDKYFMRSIPVACNTIVQEISKELDLSIKDAEQLRLTHNVIAGPNVPVVGDSTKERTKAEVVGMITRNVMCRLHAEANRSTNFYRSQQSGSVLQNVLLTGMGSKINGLADYFSEKMKVPVSNLNPFAAVDHSTLIATNIQESSHLLHGVVGLALQEYVPNVINIDLTLPKKYVIPKAKKTICDRCPFRK